MYEFPALVPMYSETHGGDDVAVFAVGPWAHLFVGNYEQNYIPYAISYAANMGPGAEYARKDNKPIHSSAESCGFSATVMAALVLAVLLFQ